MGLGVPGIEPQAVATASGGVRAPARQWDRAIGGLAGLCGPSRVPCLPLRPCGVPALVSIPASNSGPSIRSRSLNYLSTAQTPSAVARVRRQVLHLFQAQQEVQDAAVAQADLGRLDEALAQVLEPGRQHPDHEGARQQVPVVVHRGDAHVHRARQLRGVPGLPVVVRQHPPEAAQRLGRDLRAQPRDVPLQEGARERLHPSRPGRGRAREVRSWKAAAHPEPVLAPRPGLGEREAAHVHEEDAPRQRLGHAPDQIPGGAAQQQEDRVPVPVVTDRAQDLEQPRHPLHLVDDHQALAPAEQPLGGLGQRRPGRGHLQVEDRGRPRPRGRHLPGQGRLAHLPGAQQGDHRGFGQRLGDRRQQIGACNGLLHIGWKRFDIRQ